ncbi:hypothetical protein ACSBR2_034415 [Camellia fascicularis]
MATVSGTSSDLGTIELEDGLLGFEEIPHRCLEGRILATKQLNKQVVSNILHGSWKDLKWVQQVGPWSIIGYLLVHNPLVLGVPVNNMNFSWCPFWVQVHGLPQEKLTKRNGEIIGARPVNGSDPSRIYWHSIRSD